MPKDRPTFWLVIAALVVGGCLAFMSFVGIISTHSAADGARKNTADSSKILDALAYNARRGDCIRDIQGDAEQEFRTEIRLLFQVGDPPDPAKLKALLDRMQEQPNYADTVKDKCPPALAEP